MEANELRVGNWVQAPKGAIYNGQQVEWSIREFGRCWDYDVMVEFSSFQPIPLTEEWLEQFGFEQMKLYTGDNCFVKEKFCVLCDGQLKNYDLRLTFDSDQTIRVELDYVHQLQNLYHALTGEELNQKQIR